MRGAYLFLADGFEETEALATLDILRRGGLDVQTVSIDEEGFVCGSHGITVTADLIWYEFTVEVKLGGTSEKDLMVFPGGMPGTKNLAAQEELMELMKRHFNEGGTVAAICAAPGLVASQLDGLEGRKFTCFDGFEENMIAKGAEYVKAPAVADRNLITGRGAGCAIDFALKILESLTDEETVAKVRHGLMLD